MAKVIYPLHSLSASGKFAKHIIFSRNKIGGQYVHIRKIRPWKYTESRKTGLRYFSDVANMWVQLPENEKKEYNDRARKVNLSGQQLFFHEHPRSWWEQQQ